MYFSIESVSFFVIVVSFFVIVVSFFVIIVSIFVITILIFVICVSIFVIVMNTRLCYLNKKYVRRDLVFIFISFHRKNMDTNDSPVPERESFIQFPKPDEENRGGTYWELVFLKQKLSTFAR